jgi:hypothetical protein
VTDQADRRVCQSGRIAGMPAELRRAEATRPAPPRRERPVVMLGAKDQTSKSLTPFCLSTKCMPTPGTRPRQAGGPTYLSRPGCVRRPRLRCPPAGQQGGAGLLTRFRRRIDPCHPRRNTAMGIAITSDAGRAPRGALARGPEQVFWLDLRRHHVRVISVTVQRVITLAVRNAAKLPDR